METEADNISVFVVESLEQPEFDWDAALETVFIAGVAICIVGLVGNLLSFFTADFLGKSNFRVFLKCLAVWDSLSAICDGIVNFGLRLTGINPSATVSCYFLPENTPS